jgi:hypothetical protein
MRVDWHHYKNAIPECHTVLARATGRDPDSFTSKPTHACRENDGSQCTVFSDDHAGAAAFGDLVQDCFDIRDLEISSMRGDPPG